MDKRIRPNEKCVIGLPSCGYVFSSTRSCFIAYGFAASPMETNLLRHLLEARRIEPVEAGGMRAPGQNAFCAKICSKIITSRFCIILLNHDKTEKGEIPNANVNMEYGLMLGFNKYVIPFQREDQELPFNVAGLDTIKYRDADFERLAVEEIDRAIQSTEEEAPAEVLLDSTLGIFLANRGWLIVPIERPEKAADRDLSDIGSSLGFVLLMDFSGFHYTFLGNFTALRREVVIWRLKMVCRIVESRRATFSARHQLNMMTVDQYALAEVLFQNLKVLAIVTSDDDKKEIQDAISTAGIDRPIDVVSLADVRREIGDLGDTAS